MKILDYFRLGNAVSKKRKRSVGLIISIIPFIVVLFGMTLKGLEKNVYYGLDIFKDGSTFVAVKLDDDRCMDDCSKNDQEMDEIIEKYHGQKVEKVKQNEKNLGKKLDNNRIFNFLHSFLPDNHGLDGSIDGDEVIVEFSKFKDAYNFYKDPRNYCEEMDYAFKTCSKTYKYRVRDVYGTTLKTTDIFSNIWQIFYMISAILLVINIFIAFMTFGRMISDEKKNDALYYSMGATYWQNVLAKICAILSISIVSYLATIGLCIIICLVVSLLSQSDLHSFFEYNYFQFHSFITLIGIDKAAIVPLLLNVIPGIMAALVFTSRKNNVSMLK